MVTEQDQQQLVYQYQFLHSQIQQLQVYLSDMQTHITMLQHVQESLRLLEKQKGGSFAFVPLAPGVFVQGSLGTVDTVVLRVGAGVAVTKTPAEARETISVQIEEMVGAISDVESEISKISAHMQTLLSD